MMITAKCLWSDDVLREQVDDREDDRPLFCAEISNGIRTGGSDHCDSIRFTQDRPIPLGSSGAQGAEAS